MFNVRPIPLGSIREIEPVFIVGAARSGTTPFQLALNMHPELGVYGETQAFFVCRKFGADPNEVAFRRLLAYWRAVTAGCCPYNDILDTDEIRQKLAKASTYAQMLNLIMGAIAAREGKSTWGEKSPAHVFRLDEIRTCFPNARIVHMVRDPRAVVCSTIKAFRNGEFNDWNVYSAAKYWARCIEVHVRQVSANAKLYTMVRYEDFVTKPEATLKKTCSFLGIEFVEDMLSAHKVASNYVRPGRSGKMPALHALTEKPLDSTRTHAWRSTLSAAQAKLVEEVVAEQMAFVGYSPARTGSGDSSKIRKSQFSTRWSFWERQRIATNQMRSRYWALRRMLDLAEKRIQGTEDGP